MPSQTLPPSPALSHMRPTHTHPSQHEERIVSSVDDKFRLQGGAASWSLGYARSIHNLHAIQPKKSVDFHQCGAFSKSAVFAEPAAVLAEPAAVLAEPAAVLAESALCLQPASCSESAICSESAVCSQPADGIHDSTQPRPRRNPDADGDDHSNPHGV